jgi:hypothetical protein
MKLINFFLVRKRQVFFPNLFLNCALYGLDTEPEPELVKSRNQNRKNCYGSTLLPIRVPLLYPIPDL